MEDDEETTIREVVIKSIREAWVFKEELPIYVGTETYDELLQDIEWKADRERGYTFKQED